MDPYAPTLPCLWGMVLAPGLFLPFQSFSTTSEGRPSSGTAASQYRITRDAMGLLQANCFSCHNPEKHRGGLDLTSREALMEGGDEGKVVVPGKPDESLLFRALGSEADPHMPPKKQ